MGDRCHHAVFSNALYLPANRFQEMLTVLFLILMLSLQAWHPLGCFEEERIALLHLKDSLNYPKGTSLPSWIKGDAHCCEWDWRIVCDNSTGRVTELRLEFVRDLEQLGDWYLNASLFLPFHQLNVLDLSYNRIAGWVENKGGYELQKLSNLEILNLEYNSFNNSILSFVEGLPSLKSLSLGYNRLEGLIDLKESLSSLEDLSLGSNNINKLVASRGPSNLRTLWLDNIKTYRSSFQLLQSLEAFPNLTTLGLRDNDFRGRILGDDEHSLQSLGALHSLKNLSLQELNGTVPSGGFLDLKNLEYLDLSFNTLNYSIFQTIRTMTSLKTLMLLTCNLNGQLPTTQGFLNLKNLEYLDLSYTTLNNNIFQTIGTMTSLKTLMLESCNLNGQIPTTQGLCDLNHLQKLYICDNDLSGFLPPCLANVTSLQRLDLSSNHLKIPMSLSPLYNLSKLKYFDGSDNEIYSKEDDHNLSPMFQLEYLYLSGIGQGGAFPKFLYHQFSLQYLDLTNIQIKGEFPHWLIENNTFLQELYLENCSLSGPFLLPKNSHVNLSFLSISMNHLQGQIPLEIGDRLPGLEVLNMSDNGFNGIIPSSLGNMSSLYKLDLSNNVLIGRIPEYLTTGCSFLDTLILSNNGLHG
ncbi:hypothetical protein NC653_040295 [Populus alba x Populus x berolinensis]|uniref:Leucine-rich repeat-containing N-terminal plant-type domain-containing protein n=1 Tax=Populus alba x Populus x berolinensis TaxID=444605 RepID=A0AAD6LD98_9ROSI|nr:hypothetical protein NC653_040295 [Populus alba x Populus x berolinensis]